MSTEKKVRAILIGAGNRGTTYATHAKEACPELELVAIADANPVRRDYVQKMHGVPDEACYDDFRELLAKPRMADLAIIATQDKMHFEPAMLAIEQGYNIMLEKPVAPTPEECVQIAEAASHVSARHRLFDVIEIIEGDRMYAVQAGHSFRAD